MPDRPVFLFTDLDGTLLDHHTYRPGPALAAVRALQARGVAVVPVTSKTAAELRPIVAELGLRHGWVAENGAQACGPDGRTAMVFGTPYGRVRAGLAAAAAAAGATVRGFGDMPDDELADRTGLALAAVRAARCRQWSETFELVRGDPAALREQLARRGLRAVRGGRFLTVTGPHDKATAVRAILSRSPGVSWAVGDAGNDEPMLAAVDHPLQVRRHDGTWAELAVAGVIRLEGIGPYGFVEAAQRILA